MISYVSQRFIFLFSVLEHIIYETDFNNLAVLFTFNDCFGWLWGEFKFICIYGLWFQCLQTHKPGLVALHCQEVGGKNYEASMQHVNQFIKWVLQ